MSRALNPIGGARRSGFTITELIVVIAVIALLLGLLVPALMNARGGSQKLATEAQLQTISAACLNYEMSFNALPGYAAENYFSSSTYRKFSGTENLVLSLLGGVIDESTPAGNNATDEISAAPTNYTSGAVPLLPSTDYAIDVDKVGGGPRVRSGRVYDAFYQPKERELAAVEGTDRSNQPNEQNNMPELVDRAQSGVPILYFRGIPGKSQLASNNSARTFFDPASNNANINNVQFFRGPACDYLDTDALKSAKNSAVYDQANNSLLSDGGAGSHANANRNLGWLVVDTKTMTLSNPSVSTDSTAQGQPAKGRFMLMAAGEDGIYLNIKQLPLDSGGNPRTTIENPDELKLFDDVIVFGQ